MSCSSQNSCTEKTNPCCGTSVNCDEETTAEILCRHEKYLNELFFRTDDLRKQITGEGIGPYKIAFTADSGEAGPDQDLLGDAIADFDPDIGLFGGDNNYETGSHTTIDANWAVFDDLINKGAAFPALGNHDLDDDVANPGVNQYNKFPYLPGNRRYYHIYKPEASLDIFVLNSGINTAGSVVEPDGNDLGSIQYNWFINELANSSGLFKIVMFHHPYISGVTSAIDDGRVYTALNWNFKDLGIDLVLNGHTHTAQHIVTNDLSILDVSSAVRGLRNMSCSGTIYGSDAGIAELRWAYAGNCATGDRLYSEITIVGKTMVVSVNRTDDGAAVYSFPIFK